MPRKRLRVHREGYTRADGTRVAPSTFMTEDKGAPGRTPESEQFYEPKVTDTGWHNDMSQGKRREIYLEAHNGDVTASYRGMDGLAKVSTDRKTRREARKDANYFSRLIHKRRNGRHGGVIDRRGRYHKQRSGTIIA